MYTVYILRDSNGRLYKGYTNNLIRRLREHRSGKTKSTKHLENITVAYTEQYGTLSGARKRELYLKSAAGRRFLQQHMRP